MQVDRRKRPGPKRASVLAIAGVLPVGLFGMAAAATVDTAPQPAERSVTISPAVNASDTTTPTVGVLTPVAAAPVALRSARTVAENVFDPFDALGIPPEIATQVGAALPALNLGTGQLGVPVVMIDAYKKAAAALAESNPGCGLDWTLLAGIGRIESGHAAGGAVDANGNTLSPIRGPLLDGSTPGTAVIHDTDGGALDGNAQFDRAVGPMQFIPGTWRAFAADGNGDGTANPDNVYDATLAAAKYLCASGGNLADPVQRTRAILRYNNSMSYANNVQMWAGAYATGVMPTPNRLTPIQVSYDESSSVNPLAAAAAQLAAERETVERDEETDEITLPEVANPNDPLALLYQQITGQAPPGATPPAATDEAAGVPGQPPAPQAPPAPAPAPPANPLEELARQLLPPPQPLPCVIFCAPTP